MDAGLHTQSIGDPVTDTGKSPFNPLKSNNLSDITQTDGF